MNRNHHLIIVALCCPIFLCSCSENNSDAQYRKQREEIVKLYQPLSKIDPIAPTAALEIYDAKILSCIGTEKTSSGTKTDAQNSVEDIIEQMRAECNFYRMMLDHINTLNEQLKNKSFVPYTVYTFTVLRLEDNSNYPEISYSEIDSPLFVTLEKCKVFEDMAGEADIPRTSCKKIAQVKPRSNL